MLGAETGRGGRTGGRAGEGEMERKYLGSLEDLDVRLWLEFGWTHCGEMSVSWA